MFGSHLTDFYGRQKVAMCTKQNMRYKMFTCVLESYSLRHFFDKRNPSKNDNTLNRISS